jgi:hypothetical protein
VVPLRLETSSNGIDTITQIVMVYFKTGKVLMAWILLTQKKSGLLRLEVSEKSNYDQGSKSPAKPLSG